MQARGSGLRLLIAVELPPWWLSSVGDKSASNAVPATRLYLKNSSNLPQSRLFLSHPGPPTETDGAAKCTGTVTLLGSGCKKGKPILTCRCQQLCNASR